MVVAAEADRPKAARGLKQRQVSKPGP